MDDKPEQPPPMPSLAHLTRQVPDTGPTPEQQRKESARRKGRRTREWWKDNDGANLPATHCNPSK